MPELHQLGLPAQIDIVNHRRELVEHHNLAGGAGLGKVKNLADCHVRNSVIVENKMDIKVFVVLDFVIDKGKVAGDVVSSQRNKGDFVGLDLAQLEEGMTLQSDTSENRHSINAKNRLELLSSLKRAGSCKTPEKCSTASIKKMGSIQMAMMY